MIGPHFVLLPSYLTSFKLVQTSSYFIWVCTEIQMNILLLWSIYLSSSSLLFLFSFYSSFFVLSLLFHCFQLMPHLIPSSLCTHKSILSQFLRATQNWKTLSILFFCSHFCTNGYDLINRISYFCPFFLLASVFPSLDSITFLFNKKQKKKGEKERKWREKTKQQELSNDFISSPLFYLLF